MAKLEFIGVTKTYASVDAVTDIDLVIEDNEFFCIFGPPGCGKTTILRLLLGLESADSGQILIDGQIVNEATPADRNLAMVFQNLALFPHMTARQNLEFPLVERRLAAQKIRDRVEAVSEKLHITPLLEKVPAHLSGGERQRVAIGRALVREPNALLMDEPISSLDARLREEMRVELNRLQREMNRTLVYVTHDQEEAMSVADHLCVMREGRIAQIGTPVEVYNAPNSRYVAEVIGSPPMNFLKAHYDNRDGKVVVEGTGHRLDPEALGDVAIDGLDVGIRPEEVALDRERRHREAVEARVYETEPLGAVTLVDFLIDNHLLRAQMTGQWTFDPDETVFASFNWDRCHFFDDVSGRNLALDAEGKRPRDQAQAPMEYWQTPER